MVNSAGYGCVAMGEKRAEALESRLRMATMRAFMDQETAIYNVKCAEAIFGKKVATPTPKTSPKAKPPPQPKGKPSTRPAEDDDETVIAKAKPAVKKRKQPETAPSGNNQGIDDDGGEESAWGLSADDSCQPRVCCAIGVLSCVALCYSSQRGIGLTGG